MVIVHFSYQAMTNEQWTMNIDQRGALRR